MKIISNIVIFCVVVLCSCAHKSGHKIVQNKSFVNVEKVNKEESLKMHTEVKMEKQNGVYFVPIEVNGLPLKFIFDTGASNISISSAEAAVMCKQGQITQEDILGKENLQDASGNVTIGAVINLRSVKIGEIELHNVQASVVNNMQAPLLLGQTALSKFGRISIDYEKLIIEFN